MGSYSRWSRSSKIHDRWNRPPGSLNIFDISDNDFAMKFGGGLDWRVDKNIDIRVIQFDWNPIFRSDLNVGGRIGTIGSTLQNNYMFTWGLAFH